MDTRQFHKRCFALLLVCALVLGCLPRAQAASRSAIESLQSQQASLTVQKAELQKKLDGIRSSQGPEQEESGGAAAECAEATDPGL